MNGIWLLWRSGYEGDLIAVVTIPSGLSRMSWWRMATCPSAWTARRYIFDPDLFYVASPLGGYSSFKVREVETICVWSPYKTMRGVIEPGYHHIGGIWTLLIAPLPLVEKTDSSPNFSKWNGGLLVSHRSSTRAPPGGKGARIGFRVWKTLRYSVDLRALHSSW